jgi:hypothetical protein
MVEWTYSSTHAYPGHQTVVSSQLKVSALFPGKDPLIFNGKEALFVTEAVDVEKRKVLSLHSSSL